MNLKIGFIGLGVYRLLAERGHQDDGTQSLYRLYEPSEPRRKDSRRSLE